MAKVSRRFENHGGRYRGASSFGSACFACQGVGYKAFKTSPEQRAQARAKAAERKQRRGQERLAAFIEANPEMHAWMVEKAPSFDFAASMLQAVQQYGELTEGQRAAVERCIEKDKARASERAANANTADVALAAELLQCLHLIGDRDQEFARSLLQGQAKYGSFSEKQRAAAQRLVASAKAPKERLSNLHSVMQRHAKFYAGDLTLARKNSDQLVWIKHANSDRVIGKLDHGTLTLWNRPGVPMEEVRSMLEEFDDAPLQTAQKYGKLSGICCSCGRELTNDGSIEAGIGPVCAQKFNG